MVMSTKIKNSTKNKIVLGMYELAFPKDFSFALKYLVEGKEGMCINPGGVEPLEGKERDLFMMGIERMMAQLGLTEEEWRDLKNTAKQFTSGEAGLPDMGFHYTLTGDVAIGTKGTMLIQGIDFWDAIWKGMGYFYFKTEVEGKYDEYITLCNKIINLINNKGVDLNTITMEDLIAERFDKKN
jgi:hypothetical protein